MHSEYGIHFIIVVVVALICGWLAGLVTRGSGFGFAGNTLVALAGAFGAFYLTRALDVQYQIGLFGTGVTALIGAFCLLALISRLRR